MTVVAASPALQGTVSEFTDGKGQFLLPDLPPGDYDVVALYGEARLRVTAVPVDAGADRWVSARLDISMVESFILGPCGPPVIDAGSAAQKTVIDAEMLKNLPW